MIIWIIIGAVIFIALLALTFGFHGKEFSRDQFLKKIAERVDGEVVPLPGETNAFKIPFQVDNFDFWYEDRESVGFGEPTLKGYLKASTRSPFTVQFTELEKTHTIKSDIVMASKIEAADARTAEGPLLLPGGFEGYTIYTNNTAMAKHLFKNKDVTAIFRSYQNNVRGAKMLSLKILDGEVILEFSPLAGFKPSLPALQTDPSTIEDYTDQILTVVKAVQKAMLET
jgi:hypothetical protein